MREFVNIYLLKAENPEAYRKLAMKGMMIGFPVSIAGRSHRPDTQTHYHSTIKFFNPDKDRPDHVHQIANQLDLTPPDPKSMTIEPGVFKDRLGNDVYVLKLHGKDADKISEHNSKFSHLGYPAGFSYQPHISVDKNTWDHVVSSQAKTAAEAGIQFGHAELRQGPDVLQSYKPEEKLAASEDYVLEKGAIRNLAAGLAAAGTISMSPPTSMDPIDHKPDAGSHQIEATKPTEPKYDHEHMLRTIAAVESGGGKNTEHEEVNGAHAFGKYGLMPHTIHETIKMNHDLKRKFGKVLRLDGSDLKHFMEDNPGLEDIIADRHLSRLEHHFGENPSELGYAWLNGVRGTYKAKKQNHDIENHWHVRKIKSAYGQNKTDKLASN
jgi:hypothetical protein